MRTVRRSLANHNTVTRDFSTDAKPQRFRRELEKQVAEVNRAFGVNSRDGSLYMGWKEPMNRRSARLIARRRARAVLRGEEVPRL